jgi:hypothetical protein
MKIASLRSRPVSKSLNLPQEFLVSLVAAILWAAVRVLGQPYSFKQKSESDRPSSTITDEDHELWEENEHRSRKDLTRTDLIHIGIYLGAFLLVMLILGSVIALIIFHSRSSPVSLTP